MAFTYIYSKLAWKTIRIIQRAETIVQVNKMQPLLGQKIEQPFGSVIA